MAQKYDKIYCTKDQDFKRTGCKHTDTVPYDLKGTQIKITAMQSICVICGKISKWAKTSKHALGGGFEYVVQF